MDIELRSHLESFITVSPALEERLDAITETLSFAKGKFLHRPLQVCDRTYFIKRGLLRVFYKKAEKEVTDNFAAEGEWITSIYSFMRNVPDNCYIETLEPCELVAIKLGNLEQCFADFPVMERFGRMLVSQYFMEQSERVISLQFHTAQERYEFFVRTSPGKVHRVPLGMLASHLGMTQETLSRIRAKRVSAI